MIKRIFIILTSVVLLLGMGNTAFAQSPSPAASAPVSTESDANDLPAETATIPQDEYSRAVVVSTENVSAEESLGQTVQKVKLRLISGSESGKELEVEHGSLFAISEAQKVSNGETVVMVKTQGPAGPVYYITDKYRTPAVGIIFAIFFGLAVFFGRVKGIRSILGLLLSIIILIQFVIPQILLGGNPLIISLSAAVAIAILSLYLAHGMNKRTTVALISTLITLVIAAVLSVIFVQMANLTGTGSEEAIFLQMGPIGSIDLKGLLLGGIIIGALGVLDDITIGQSATIEELKKANPRFTQSELYKKGVSLGQEHIASLINTLALAYAGASFPLLLLFSLAGNVPFWLTFNSEFIIEEVIRTLVGSTALILAVPISTFLAAYAFGKQNIPAVDVVEEKPSRVVRRPRAKTSARKTSRKASK